MSIAAGAAYVFGFDASSGLWEERQKLTASEIEGGYWFGFAVRLSGETLALTSPWDDVRKDIHRGAVRLFRHDRLAAVWEEVQELEGANGVGDWR